MGICDDKQDDDMMTALEDRMALLRDSSSDGTYATLRYSQSFLSEELIGGEKIQCRNESSPWMYRNNSPFGCINRKDSPLDVYERFSPLDVDYFLKVRKCKIFLT